MLGSLNLSAFVNENKTFDFVAFTDAVNKAVIYLNNVLDSGLNSHPLQEQRESAHDWRQIGLGIMGLADMLIKMEITYGSDESFTICSAIAKAMIDSALYSSAMLARDFGPYPNYTPDVLDTEFFRYNASAMTKEAVQKYGLRNSQLLTIAPTGTISTMLGISGGIEPIFANSYTRKTESLHDEGDVYYKVYTPIVESYMQEHGITNESDLPEWFVTSADIDPIRRVKMQAIWQKSIDASISSTVNLPNSATIDDVKGIYEAAWRHGLKGITVFRNGCKRAGILTTDTDENTEKKELENLTAARFQLRRGDIIQCDDELVGKKRKLVTGCGTAHLQAWGDPDTGDILETFVSKGSTGGCRCNQDAVSRLISLSLRAGVPLSEVADQLLSCGGCDSYRARTVTKRDTSKGSSCPSAIGYALLDMAAEFESDFKCDIPCDVFELGVPKPPVKEMHSGGAVCPDCGAAMRMEGGCDICVECGYSHCG